MRPKLHFTARSGWINDPHGITYRDGGYHLFFQYVPDSTTWAPNCHWGHAVGPDLLSLRELPIAIAPGDGEDGIWTGALALDDAARARVFYTAIDVPDFGIGRVRMATPADDGWGSWNKGAIVAQAPPNLDIVAFRDPFVRREQHGWRMFLGAALSDGTAAALAYTSDDLDNWTYEGITLQRSTNEIEGAWMGTLWECPQFFDLDGGSVMVSSVWKDDVPYYAGYALGTDRDGIFTADSWGRLTYGDSYYAPSLFTDSAGRPCLLLWMRGIGGADAGWAGAHSVPHLLSLRDGQLVATPHPDVAAHRGAAVPDGEVPGTAADIVWGDGDGQLTVRSAGRAVTTLRRDGDSLQIDMHDGPPTQLSVFGQVRVIIDGPTLEISSVGAIFGAPLGEFGESLSVGADGGQIEVFPLA